MEEADQDFCEQAQQVPTLDGLESVSCTTFNILAPIYKRMSSENCESEFHELWVSRNERILDRLLDLKSSIICLQEFWVSNEELVQMYEKRLKDAGYLTYKVARTNNRGDGLLTALHQNQFHVLNCREFIFSGIGDRVAQLLHVELLVRSSQQSTGMEKGALIVNTHLIFPHDSSYCFVRLKQNLLLDKAPRKDVDLLHFLETDGNYVTYSQFFKALSELDLFGHSRDCLSNEDIKDLWELLDTDGDGVIDLSDFSIKDDGEENGSQEKEMPNKPTSVTSIGFNVKKAMLFPPEVERGMWPENYSLSDHAQLTVEFSPMQLQNF